MSCDICGKTGTYLYDVREVFQTERIKVMCPDCDKVVTKRTNKILEWALNVRVQLTKRFMIEQREQLLIPRLTASIRARKDSA